MSFLWRHRWILIFLLIFPSGLVRGQSSSSGELGIDLEGFGFSSKVRDAKTSLSVDRTMSNHFLNLRFNGPIVNNNFANYSLRANILGTYLRSKTGIDQRSDYLSPKLNGLFGLITLFPSRRYPLQIYRNKSNDYSLRYESGNRSARGLVQPELTVIRRYEGERTSMGGLLQLAISEKVRFTADIKRSETQTVRNYDFNEDRDIFVSTRDLPDNPLKLRDTLAIINSLPDAAVLVIIGNVSDTIDPGELEYFVVDQGLYDVQFLPLTYYNQYRFSADIKANGTWTIIYNPPPSPDDRQQESSLASFRLSLGGNGKLTSESSLDIVDATEIRQENTSEGTSFSNNATYAFSRQLSFNSLTTMSSSESATLGSDPQENTSLLQMTNVSYATNKGFSTTFAHSFNRNASIFTDYENINTLNDFNHSLTIPTGWLKHTARIRNTLSLLSDNQGYVNNQYALDIDNAIEKIFLGARLRPRHRFSYTKSTGADKDDNSTQIESRLSVSGEIDNLRQVGDVKFQAAYSYRRQNDNVGSTIRGRYRFDITVDRRVSARLALRLSTNHEIQTYGGSTPESGGIEGIQSTGATSERRSIYRLGWSYLPFSDISISGSYGVLVQKLSNSVQIGLGVVGTLPLIKVPFETRYSQDTRKIVGFGDQSSSSLTGSVNHRFRRIRMQLEFSYLNEDLFTVAYGYYEIKGTVSRQFSLF